MKKTLLLLFWIFLSTMSYTQAELFSEYQWKNRLVVLLYDSTENIEYKSQQILIKRNEEGYKERDIEVFAYHHNDPLAIKLQGYYDLPAKGFVFVLIGKDGYAKLIKERRVMPTTLFAIIDAMPMRRAEIERLKKRSKK